MKKFLLTILSTLMLIGMSPCVTAQAATASTATPGVVRVKLQKEVAKAIGKKVYAKNSIQQLSLNASALMYTFDDINGVSIRPMLPENPKYAAQRAEFGLDQWYVVEFDPTMTPQEAVKRLKVTSGVLNAETIVPLVLKEGNGAFKTVSKASAAKATTSYPFNDPYLPDQWHYQNYGTYGTDVAGADINLFEAWKISTGSSKVTVAIIDGGIDYSHQDLAGNMYINYAELNGQDGVDDDGNGYVDDVYGYNFCTNSGTIYPHSHGTHVAGTVGAVNNNGIGVSGIAGGDGTSDSGVKLLSCQVFDSRSGVGEGDFAAAIVYACEMGATIAQCSWGWADADYYEQAVLDAIDYFTAKAQSDNMVGGLMIFAAGNYGEYGNFYPACYDKVVGVTAMTSELLPASYSNYGEWADIIAPGGDETYAERCGVLSTLPDNEYGYNEGTSMACPHVSGVAALILSKYGSSTFVNENLRTQLITSVNDFYSFGSNSQYSGLYGSGYLDANKAMQMGDGTAPEAVQEFELNASQDYIVVTWNIPASSDNNVHSHIIYYSTEPFTADSDLSKLNTVVADTKFYTSGDEVSQTISDLDPLTTYYVAIKAVNRWGVAADLSPVQEIRTNEGPKMTLSKSSVSMSTSASNSTGTASFVINNEAEGILNWTTSSATVSATAATRSVKQSTPVPGALAQSYSGSLGIEPYASTAAHYVAEEYDKGDYPQYIKYYSSYYAVIGDSDLSQPNSMAQFFWVDPEVYPNGFNLTHLNIDTTYGTNPIVQIYNGSNSISSATLLQQVSYSYFAANYPMALNEQIHFDAGASFWVVVHFEGGQEGYSLPVGKIGSDYSYASGYSYMSNDMGKTWLTLAQAFEGSSYAAYADVLTWGITCRSNNPDFSEMLVLSPAQGTVLKNSQQEVVATIDGSKIVNGTYKFNLHINTNEPGNTDVKLPFTCTIAGNPYSLEAPKVVDFGSLLVGETKTLSVDVYNSGYGLFAGSAYAAGIYSNKISSTSEHFSGPSSVSTGFPARCTTSVELTYTPTEAGSHNGNIIFKDKNNNEFRIFVRGVATDPAKVKVDPAEIEAGTLDVDAEATTVEFAVSNEGNYPLEYVFPKFSDKTIENTSKLHKYGYVVESNISGYNGGFEYDGNPELLNTTEIQSQFSDDVYVSSAIDLGFSFPYYGQDYDKVYITSFGGIMFAPNSVIFRAPLTPENDAIVGTGLISAYGRDLNFGANSKIEYAKADGEFVVKFSNVLGLVYDKDFTPISFRIVLSSNGDIKMYYDDYNSYSMFEEGSTLFCGINDFDVEDNVSVTDRTIAAYTAYYSVEETEENQRYHQFNTGTAVKFVAPKGSFVTDLTNAYGMVSPGESVTLTATLKATEDLVAGETYNDLAIVTNDPNPEYSKVRINATITGASLLPEASLAQDNIDLGDVFRTSDSKAVVTVTNNGKAALEVTAITIDGEGLSTELETPFTIDAKMSKDIIVKVDTETSRAIEGTVTVATAVADLAATVKANVIGCPTVELSFTEVNESLMSGEELHRDLVISNSGDEDLVYAMTPNAIAKYTLPETENGTTSYNYSFTDDGDEAAQFDWIDIETTGLGTQTTLSYFLLKDYIEVELPFEFPFYGKKYNTMYVYNTGFVSFTKQDQTNDWPEPPADFPDGTIYTNIIAPYWGLHTPDQTKTAGVFHYLTEDQAVVSFMEYANSMNSGVCYQLILNSDGTFKFQYKPYSDYSQLMGTFGLAGISSIDAKEGIKIPDYMIAFNKAVSFVPVVENTIAPGENHTIGMDFDTKRMAGTYTTTLKGSTNVPSKETIEIPVTLNISGVAKPVWPNDTIVEHPLGYRSTDYTDYFVQQGALYYAEFTVKNEGTAVFSIDNIEVGGPSYYDEWFDSYSPYFYLFYEGPEYDWWGDPTGNKAWSMYYGGSVNVDEDGIRFCVPMLENELAYTMGTYEIPLTFTYTTEAGTEQKVVTVTFVITDVPVMSLDKDQIVANAATDNDIIVESLKISNVGNYKLEYNLVLDPTGIGEEVDDANYDYGVMSAQNLKTVAAVPELTAAVLSNIVAHEDEDGEDEVNQYNLPTNFEYTDALYYPALGTSPSSYVYGSASTYDEYKAAVTYVAPEDGFNISHLYMPVYNPTVDNYSISYSIVQGSDPDGDVVIGSGSAVITKYEDNGKFYVLPLDKAVYLNPNEEFTVVVNFSAGVAYPSYLVAKEESVVTDRYRAWIESYGWFDVAELLNDTYGSLGYILTCIETVPGQPWIRLLDSTTEGVLEVSGETEVQFELSAASARVEKNNKAVLVIKTNDPSNSVYNFPIYLNCNSRPTITLDKATYTVPEGSTATVVATIADEDCDDMTIALTDDTKHATIESVLAADGDQATITVSDEGVYSVSGATQPVTMTVKLSADYNEASTGNLFTITVEDAANHSVSSNVRYDITFSNRAPVAVSDENVVELGFEQISSVYNFADYFYDPDGDELTYTFEMKENSYAEAFTTSYGVVFYSGIEEGEAVALLTATDIYGASTTIEITVVVDPFLGVDDITADQNGSLKVMPNPVADVLNAWCGFSAQDAVFTVYTTNGAVVAQKTADAVAGAAVEMNVANLPAGIYLLAVSSDSGCYSARFIKL